MERQNKDPRNNLVFTLRFERVSPGHPIPVSQLDRVIQKDGDYYLFCSDNEKTLVDGPSREYYQSCSNRLYDMVRGCFSGFQSLSVTYEIPKTEDEIKEGIQGSSLAALDLTPRLIRILENEGIMTVGDLVNETKLDSPRYRYSKGLGRLSLKSIREALSNKGLI